MNMTHKIITMNLKFYEDAFIHFSTSPNAGMCSQHLNNYNIIHNTISMKLTGKPHNTCILSHLTTLCKWMAENKCESKS